MKNKLNVLLITFLSFSFSLLAISNATPIQVKGKIESNGIGVPSVMVTDGVAVVQTDKNGKFALSTNSEREFVYYSLPSGYESPVALGVPVFYAPIDKNKKKQVRNFAIQPSKQSQTKHAFIVLGDPQVKTVDEFDLLSKVIVDMNETVADLPTELPVHAMSMGDNVFDELQFFDQYKQIISKTKLPFYQLVGNHDMDYNERSDELSAKSYTAKFGPAYYSFNKGRIHYVVLKDVFYYGNAYKYIGYINENQLQWLEKDLATVKPGSTVIVSLHIPTVYGESEYTDNFANKMSNSVMNSAALFKIIAPFNTHIMAGHSHTQWNTIISPKLFEHTHSAACAAWWQGEIGVDGTPKGYTVYSVNGDSISWYFKTVELSKDEQFKLYPIGSELLYPDCVIANVYNYDPKWKVNWYENGVLMGEMEQYWGVDPLAKSTYIPKQNKKYWWLSAGETHHLFKAKIVNPNVKITVKVTDRFGKLYEKNL